MSVQLSSLTVFTIQITVATALCLLTLPKGGIGSLLWLDWFAWFVFLLCHSVMKDGGFIGLCQSRWASFFFHCKLDCHVFSLQ